MPKKVVAFFSRRKEGEEPDGRLTRQINVSYEDLEALFHLPLRDAARKINLCATTIKKACRIFGMGEWPFRKGRTQVPVARMAAPTLQTTELFQANRAVMVSCTSPVWPMALPRSFSAPLATAPPREQSVVEAVMDYLEGPLVGNFEFMFVDEEGAPEVGALLDGDDNGAE